MLQEEAKKEAEEEAEAQEQELEHKQEQEQEQEHKQEHKQEQTASERDRVAVSAARVSTRIARRRQLCWRRGPWLRAMTCIRAREGARGQPGGGWEAVEAEAEAEEEGNEKAAAGGSASMCGRSRDARPWCAAASWATPFAAPKLP